MALLSSIFWFLLLLGLPPALLWRGLRGRKQGAARAPLAAALCLAALLPLGSLGVYIYIGQQQMPPPQLSQEDLLQQLEARLAAQPEDADLQHLAARHYLGLNQYRKAADAFARLQQLQPDNPDALAGRAEALSLLDADAHREAIKKLVGEALRLNPQHPDALWLDLLGAIRHGDLALFHTRLQQLRTLGQDDPVWRQRLEALRQLRDSSLKP